MSVPQQFVNSYKAQYYSSQATTIPQLMNQQKELIDLLEQLHLKTQRYFQTLCDRYVKKNQNSRTNTKQNRKTASHKVSKLHRQEESKPFGNSSIVKLSKFSSKVSFNQDNNIQYSLKDKDKEKEWEKDNRNDGGDGKLPSLVIAEAEIRNCQSYRGVLEKERIKLQNRVGVAQANFKNQSVERVLKSERDRIVDMLKGNRSYQLEIKRLGDKLSDGVKTPAEIHQELLQQVKQKRLKNLQKQEKIYQNLKKIESLHQKTASFSSSPIPITQSLFNPTQSPLQVLLHSKHQSLQNSLQALRHNIASIRTRLSQQYYCKLKQLESVVDRNMVLDGRIEEMRGKVMEKSMVVLSQSRVLA